MRHEAMHALRTSLTLPVRMAALTATPGAAERRGWFNSLVAGAAARIPRENMAVYEMRRGGMKRNGVMEEREERRGLNGVLSGKGKNRSAECGC